MIMAPMAPMAPAWFTVAIPMMIEPRTAKMRVNGGTSARKTLTAKLQSKAPSKGTGGAVRGRTSARIRI